MPASPMIPTPADPARLASDRRVAVGIFFLALAVYFLTYTGAFKSNDERAMASGTDSFVKRGEFTVNQIYWDYTNVGMLTSRGDMVPNYEPAQMVLAVPLYLWGRALGASAQGVLFFNAIVTAAAVAMLYLCFLELGYSRLTGTVGTLVFAFATLAWPYARTFFREPLTVLAYLLAFYGLLRYRPPAHRHLRWLALAGAATGLALTTKQISVAMLPSVLLLLVAYEWRRPLAPGEGHTLWGVRLRAAAALLLPLLAFLLLGWVYNQVTLGGVELFARNIIEYTTNPQLSQSVPARMLRALLGITVSPYKGLFWYAPVLLLGLIGAWPFTRRFRWEGLAFLLLIAAHLLGYSRYNYWSGGVAWGMRYLLPIVPFLILLAAPVWDWLVTPPPTYLPPQAPGQQTTSPSRWPLRLGVFAIVALIGLSTAIQVVGISVDLRTYELRFLLDQAEVWGGIGEAIDALYLQPAYSPVLGHLRLLLSGKEPLDFAWVQRREMGTTALVPQALLLCVAFLALAVGALVAIWREPRRALVVGLGMAVAAAVTASLLLFMVRQGDARYDTYGTDRFLRPMMESLQEVPCGWAGCQEALLVPDASLTDYFLNYLDAPLVWYGTESQPVDQQLMDSATGRFRRLWLGRDRSAATDDQEGRRGVERYLAEHAYKLGEQGFDDWARLLQYSAAGRPAEVAAPQQALGEMVLQRVALGLENSAATAEPQPDPAETAPGQPLDDGQVLAQPGDTLQIGLTWQATRPPDANYTVFVQLLDEASQVRAQSDRWPGDGLFPTAGLAAGQAITDNLALPLDVPPGRYQLIAGLYQGDVEGLPRLAGPGGDFVSLGQIVVTEPGGE